MISHPGGFLVCHSIPVTWERQEGMLDAEGRVGIMMLRSYLLQTFFHRVPG